MGISDWSSDVCSSDLPTLFFEFHGTEAGAREQAELVGEIARDYGGANFKWATRQEDRTKLWQARHDAYFANLAMKPGAKGWATDVCVPISRLAECILETRQDIRSEEHTSELQSLMRISYAVFCLKNKTTP